MAKEADVDVEVMAEGEQKLILPTDQTLTRNGRFLATTRRARYLLSRIKLNRQDQ